MTTSGRPRLLARWSGVCPSRSFALTSLLPGPLDRWRTTRSTVPSLAQRTAVCSGVGSDCERDAAACVRGELSMRAKSLLLSL